MYSVTITDYDTDAVFIAGGRASKYHPDTSDRWICKKCGEMLCFLSDGDEIYGKVCPRCGTKHKEKRK